MESLKERFERFMLSTKGIESIDALMKDCNLPGRQWADYLASNRHFIIEQKSLDVNPDDKIRRFLERLASVGQLPGPGDMSLAELLIQVPDGPALFEELRERVTKVLDDIIAKADDQIRDTRQTFLIPESSGIVVVLNEHAPLLSPDIAFVRLFDTLRKRRPEGELRYVENQVIILISEAHVIDSGQDATMFSMATIYSDAGNERPLLSAFVESLKQGWAAFNNAGYLEESEASGQFQTA